MTAIEFLKRSADGKHRIVSSGDLHVMQISEAQANKLFFVDDETGLGWALVPWELTTAKDRSREEGFFIRGLVNVVVAHDDASNHQAIYIDGKLHSQDSTIYAHDITDAVGGPLVPFRLEQKNYDDIGEGDWPKTLEELEKRVATSA